MRDWRILESRVVAGSDRDLRVRETGGRLAALVGRRETHINGGARSRVDRRVSRGDGYRLPVSLEEESVREERDNAKDRDTVLMYGSQREKQRSNFLPTQEEKHNTLQTIIS